MGNGASLVVLAVLEGPAAEKRGTALRHVHQDGYSYSSSNASAITMRRSAENLKFRISQ